MDRRLKQRLVGVTVLVALAVIIIPEMVQWSGDRSPPSGVTVDAHIPPPPPAPERGLTISLEPPLGPADDTPETVTRLLDGEQPPPPDEEFPAPPPQPSVQERPTAAQPPVAEQPEPPPPTGTAVAKSPPKREPEPPPDSELAATEPEPPPAEPQAAPPQAAPPQAAPPAEAVQLPKLELIARSRSGAAPAAPAPEPVAAWQVQTGSFSRRENADQQRQRLADNGFNVQVRPHRLNGRTLYRVRVGPLPSRDESERVLSRLQGLDINGQVVAPGE